VTFLDTLLQITLLQDHSQDLLLPTSLQKLAIDAKWHAAEVQNLDGKNKNVRGLVLFSLHDIV
jgi:hypothetical protein